MTLPIKRGHPELFPCGHKRIRENMTSAAKPACVICKREREREKLTRFRCGHDVTPENTVVVGEHGYRRCRHCYETQKAAQLETLARARSVKLQLFVHQPAPLRISPPDTQGRSYNLAPRRSA